MHLPSLLYDIKTIIHNGVIPDDSRVDNRLIIQWINNQRVMFLNREYDKGRSYQNNEMQVLPLVELEIVDSTEVVGIDLGASIIRSKQKLPRTVQSRFNDGVVQIRGLDMISPDFNYFPRVTSHRMLKGRYNRNMIGCFKHNDYLYVIHGDQNHKVEIPMNLRMEIVAEDPLTIDEFNKTYDSILEGNSEYPISQHFADYIKEMILKLDIGSMFNLPIDNSNDNENTN